MTEPGIYIDGLKQLRAGFKAVDADIPKLLNRELKAQISARTLPKVRARTPRRSGRLAARTRVAVSGASVAITNPLPYANAIHWGREFWPNQKSPDRRRSPIASHPFIYSAVMDDRDDYLRDLTAAIETALDRVMPH